MTEELIFSDISHHNVGEAVYENGKIVGEIIHDLNWDFHQNMGVTGTIIKAIQGNYTDPAYHRLASSCPLQFHTAYGYLDYTRLHYVIGKEVEWGKKQGQKLCEISAKYNHTLRLSIDYEKNAYWEPLNNLPTSNYSFKRANKICLAMIEEILRLMSFLPTLYLNFDVTRYMNKDFWSCPLWISRPGTTSPIPGKHFLGFSDYDLWQYTWTADGKKYGNFTGNKTIDLNKVKNLKNLLSNPANPPIDPPIIVPVSLEERVLRLESEAKSHGWTL